MALNLNKNYMCKITINIPKWLVPGWVSLFFAIFAALSFCMPYTQETYSVPLLGKTVQEVTANCNIEDLNARSKEEFLRAVRRILM